MRTYASPSEGLADAMRLSAAMTRKMAVLDAPFGGGKAVLAVPELPMGEARRSLLLRYGSLVASLGGTFRTAGDINTTQADLEVIAERCPYVYGLRAGDSGVGTARGVFHGIHATAGHLFGSDDIAGLTVLVQGVGSVGAPLAEMLSEAGADVLVSDVAAGEAERLAARIGARVVDPDEAIGTDCDVFAPCAVGGTLSAETIPSLRCRIVAGSANNQLADESDARRLQEAGILYAPDYVINGGGVVQLMGVEDLGWDDVRLERELARIGDTLREVYAIAELEGLTTAEAADRLAARRLLAPVDSAGLPAEPVPAASERRVECHPAVEDPGEG